MSIFKNPRYPSQEALDSPKTILEQEYVFYVRITNFKQLENAAHAEKHEQWQIKIPSTDDNAGSGSIRARKVTSADGTISYELTTKSKTKKGNIETTVPTTEENFTQIAFMANSGMRKDRYTFPIPNSDLSFEVDVYPDGKAGYYTWAKIDLEVKSPLSSFPELPIQVEEIITPQDAETPEGQEEVSRLFDTFFLLKNKYKDLSPSLKPDTTVEPEVNEVSDQEEQEITEDVKEIPESTETDQDAAQNASSEETADDNTTTETKDNSDSDTTDLDDEGPSDEQT
jgi:hypothetical protein|nr:MAG TPA: hypothetical protein [Caudoviricetes sp.]